MLGGVGGFDWPASALLMNMISSRIRTNSKMCAYTLIYDGAQLILWFTGSILPGSWALTRILTNSHIFASGAHMTIFFTYLETPTSPLSSYVHFILLCRLAPMSARLVYGFVDAGAYELMFVLLAATTTTLSNTLATPRKRFFLILGDNVAH